jgi:hypothetical protein
MKALLCFMAIATFHVSITCSASETQELSKREKSLKVYGIMYACFLTALDFQKDSEMKWIIYEQDEKDGTQAVEIFEEYLRNNYSKNDVDQMTSLAISTGMYFARSRAETARKMKTKEQRVGFKREIIEECRRDHWDRLLGR